MRELPELLKLRALANNPFKEKILEMFIIRAGNKLEKKCIRALELLQEGKDFGRALADSLDRSK